MTALRIDKDVPLPGWTELRQAMLAMQPGDSALVVGRSTTWAANAIRKHQSRSPELSLRVFTCRREGDGVRVWRMT